MPKLPDPLVAEGQITDGVLSWSTAWQFFKAALKRWPNGRVTLTIAPVEETRRARANRWLFGPVYTEILREMNGRKPTTGEKAEFHEAMKLRHNPIQVTDPFSGEVKTVGGPTHTMTVSAFCAFTESVMLDGSEAFGIMWPEPRPSEDWRTPAKRTRAA